MADAMDTLKGILGDDAEDKIKNVMSQFSGSGSDTGSSDDYLNEMKDVLERLGSSHSDPRANLLMSLRPYMSSNRQKSIDGAIRLLNLSKLSGLLKL